MNRNNKYSIVSVFKIISNKFIYHGYVVSVFGIVSDKYICHSSFVSVFRIGTNKITCNGLIVSDLEAGQVSLFVTVYCIDFGTGTSKFIGYNRKPIG